MCFDFGIRGVVFCVSTALLVVVVVFVIVVLFITKIRSGKDSIYLPLIVAVSAKCCFQDADIIDPGCLPPLADFFAAGIPDPDDSPEDSADEV